MENSAALLDSPISSRNSQFVNSIVDTPGNIGLEFTKMNSLKRCRSVPMGINFVYSSNEIMSPEPMSSDSSSEENSANANLDSSANEEENRHSVSFNLFDRRANLSAGVSRHRHSTDMLTSPMPVRLRDRGIEKLKREANVKSYIETDYATEKLSVTGAAIMGSLDEFSIDDPPSTSNGEQRKRAQSLTEPVHVLTNFLPSPCSPSPTRIEKQCYSPSMQQVVRGIALSPAGSPSPSRHHSIRSLSPIAVRGSLKRKYDSDTESNFVPIPYKRFGSSLPSTPPFTPLDRYPRTPQAIDQSVSVNSMDSESSGSTAISDLGNMADPQTKIQAYHQQVQALLGLVNTNSPGTSTIASPISNSTELPENVDDCLMDDT